MKKNFENVKYEADHLEKYNPFPFAKNANNNRVYGEIYLDEVVYFGESDGGQIRISASLVNEQMLNMEYEAREREDTPLFFYEFCGEMSFDSKVDLIKWEILYSSEGGKDNIYAIQIIDAEESEVSVEERLREYRDQVAFEGEITFSASPVLSHRVIIVVEDLAKKTDNEAYKKLIATYDVWDNNIKSKCVYDQKKILSELDVLFDDKVKSREIRIYNVGQANCCYCDLTTKKIFFDIGVSRSGVAIETPVIQQAVQEISTLDVDAVILSHWDLDHILGVCYNENCLKQKIWIVPDFEKMYSKPRVSIKRVCNYLIRNGKSELFMVDTSANNKLFYESCNKAVTIYMGELRASHCVNKMNNGGLLLKLENKKNILMPGDCENQVIQNVTGSSQYDNVLVPHHGAVMSKPTLWGKKGKKNSAYISCGEIMGHCNLDSGIVKKYKANRFVRVRNTKNLTVNNKFRIRL